jgi:tRNA-specific 2-thiouridylase
LGEHVGLSFYTLGQRKGIGIGGVKEHKNSRSGGDHEPWFVARKDISSNTLYIVQGHGHPWLQANHLSAKDINWVAGKAPEIQHISAKTRYRQKDASAQLKADSQAHGFDLHFQVAQWAVTPGQSAVIYEGEVCLGGGVITEVSA